MSTAQLLAGLQARGVRLRAEGGRLKVEAPKGALTPADRQALAERKADLLAALSGWNQAEACRLLVSVQERLGALLGDAPVPEMDLVVSAAYARLAAAHDTRNWLAFIEALESFERAWRERICRH
jgi:hypothetical protein